METTTKHTCGEGNRPLPFGKRAPEGECKRCDELRAGAAPRGGWSNLNADNERREAEHRAAMRAQGRCICGKPRDHGICTYGDW